MKILQDRIVIDAEDFLAGFVPVQGNNSVKIIGKEGKGASFMLNFDPFRVPGFAAPGNNPSSLTGVGASVPANVLVDAVQDLAAAVYAYAIGGSTLHQIDVTTNTLSTAGDWPHTIPDAGHGGHASFSFALGSIVVYNLGSNRRLFYSWNDGTDWDVGMFDLSATFNDDFMSTTPATPLGTTAADLTEGQGLPHPLYVSEQDGLLYMGSSRFVHSFDGATGANGTFNRRVFELPVGFEVVGFAETATDFVVYGSTSARTGRRSRAVAFFFGPYRTKLPYQKVFLEDDDVSAPFNYAGTIGCFTRNRMNGRSVLRLLEGSRFKPKFLWSGNLPTIGGVDIWSGLILWNSAGLVYGYGSLDEQLPIGAFQISRGAGTSDGFLKSFITGDLYISTGAGTSGGLQRLLSNQYFTDANFQSLTAFPNFPKGKRGRVTEVKVTFFDIASAGRTLDLNIYTNNGQTTTVVFTGVSSVTASNMVRWYRKDTSGNAFPQFSDIKATLVWGTGAGATSAPRVEKIEIFYETVDF